MRDLTTIYYNGIVGYSTGDIIGIDIHDWIIKLIVGPVWKSGSFPVHDVSIKKIVTNNYIQSQIGSQEGSN